MEWSTKGQECLQKARRLHHMAIDYYRRRDFIKAISSICEALRFRLSALPTSHPQVLATLEFLIHLLAQSRPVEEQLPHLQMLLEGTRERFGRCHLETEQVMSQLASVYERMGYRKEADALNTEIWRIRCMSSSDRAAADFQDAFAHLPTRHKKKVVPTLLNPTGEEEPEIVPARTSALVESNVWMERLKLQMSMKPHEREAARAKWEAEDRERQMQKLFTGGLDAIGAPSSSSPPETAASTDHDVDNPQPQQRASGPSPVGRVSPMVE